MLPRPPALIRLGTVTALTWDLAPKGTAQKRDIGCALVTKRRQNKGVDSHFSTEQYTNVYLSLIPSNFSPHRELSPERDKYHFSTEQYRNVYLSLIPGNFSPHRELSPEQHKSLFSTALYRNIDISLIPSNFSPKRECSAHRDKYHFSTALSRNMYLTHSK